MAHDPRGGVPQETLEVRKARRLLAVEDECREWGHRFKVPYNATDAVVVCGNGCGGVFNVVFQHTKEL